MNLENNALFSQPPQPPQADPRVDRLAGELEVSWNQYQSLREAAERLAQRPNMHEKLIISLKDIAKKQLDDDIAISVRRFMGHEESVKKETAKPERPSSGASSEEAPRQEKPQPAPPSAKKLCRTDYDKMLAGVCGGVGEYFNIDSSIVRLIFVISSFVYLIGVVAYIVLTILLPVKLTPEEEC